MIRYRFPRVGGHPALDFLNTVHDWTARPRRDYLATFEVAVGFGEAAGVLTRAEARRLAALDDGRELGRLVALRAVLQRVMSALVAGRRPAARDLRALARAGAAVAQAARLRRAARGLRRTIDVADTGAAALRLRLADAALSLLASEAMVRVKACPACGWFFVDTSKNRSRRWCSMSTCGASAKAKRYYLRRKARRSRARSGAADMDAEGWAR